MFKLKEVRWEWSQYDRFEGILIANFKCEALITGKGLFVEQSRSDAKTTIDVVIQTAHHTQPSSCPDACMAESAPNFEVTCENYLRTFVEQRIKTMAGRLLEDNLCLFTLRCFKSGFLEIVDDFNPIYHFGSSDPIVRFLAQYGYALEALDDLERDYQTNNKENVLLDSRLLKSLKFLGGRETRCSN